MLTSGSYITWVCASPPIAGQSPKPCRLRLVDGNGAADPETDAPLFFSEAQARIDALVSRGVIEERDRKARCDGCAWVQTPEGSYLEIRVGPTQYYDCMRDLEQTSETRRRAELGLERHGDPKRYLACGLGVLVLPTTIDGRVLLGVRGGHTYSGWMHGPAGWLPFERDVTRIDPLMHARLECEEELGVTDLGTLDLLGVVSYTASFETDLVFTTTVPDRLLDDLVEHRGWTRAADAHEHTEFLLVSPTEVLSVKAHAARPLVPSTEFGLRTLAAWAANSAR